MVTNDAVHPTKGLAEGAGFRPSAGHQKPLYVAAVALASELMNDVGYQYRFRRDFTRRRVHPSIETLIWHYVAGKPKESIQMAGSIGFSERLEAERELFGKLSVEDLEELAKDSERLLAKARAMAGGCACCLRKRHSWRADRQRGDHQRRVGREHPVLATSTMRSGPGLCRQRAAAACRGC